MAKAKGTTMLPAVEFLRANADRARGLLPEELHHYLDPNSMVASHGWYPEAHFIALIRCQGQLSTAPPGEDVYEWIGAERARRQFGGTYKDLVKDGSRTEAGTGLARIWKFIHDSGTVESREIEPGLVHTELKDFGMPDRVFCKLFTGWLRQVPSILTGGRNSGQSQEVYHSLCVCSGDSLCRWETRYKVPERS